MIPKHNSVGFSCGLYFGKYSRFTPFSAAIFDMDSLPVTSHDLVALWIAALSSKRSHGRLGSVFKKS